MFLGPVSTYWRAALPRRARSWPFQQFWIYIYALQYIVYYTYNVFKVKFIIKFFSFAFTTIFHSGIVWSVGRVIIPTFSPRMFFHLIHFFVLCGAQSKNDDDDSSLFFFRAHRDACGIKFNCFLFACFFSGRIEKKKKIKIKAKRMCMLRLIVIIDIKCELLMCDMRRFFEFRSRIIE